MNIKQILKIEWLCDYLLSKGKKIIHTECQILCKEIFERNNYCVLHIIIGLNEDTLISLVEQNETIPKKTILYETYRILLNGSYIKTKRSNKKCR